MAYPCRPQDIFCERPYSTRKHFSNPYVEYRETDTGIAGERENWWVLRSTAATLADFRDANELRAFIAVDYNTYTHLYSFTSNPCGGSGGYSYEWRISYENPYNYSYRGIVSTGQTYTPSSLSPGVWYIKLTVRAGSGQVATAYTSVYVQDTGGCDPGDFFCGPSISQQGSGLLVPEQKERVPGQAGLLSPYPNPFNPSTVISLTLPGSRQIKVAVYDIAGREVAVLAEGRLAAGTHPFRFDAGNLSSGVYVVRLQAGDVVQTQKITLLK